MDRWKQGTKSVLLHNMWIVSISYQWSLASISASIVIFFPFSSHCILHWTYNQMTMTVVPILKWTISGWMMELTCSFISGQYTIRKLGSASEDAANIAAQYTGAAARLCREHSMQIYSLFTTPAVFSFKFFTLRLPLLSLLSTSPTNHNFTFVSGD